MTRLSPLIKDTRNLCRGYRPAVDGLDDNVVCLVIPNTGIPVGIDPLIERHESITELPDGTSGEVTILS